MINDRKMLDLGCGIRKRADAVGVDMMPNDVVDVVHDLNQYPYPFLDDEFDDILLDNSIEHLDDIVLTMEELHRISKDGARIVIKVPYFRSHWAMDPTHKHYFAAHAFFVFDPAHDFHKFYKYSSKAFFHVEKIIFDEDYPYNFFKKIMLSLPKWFANKYPMKYEEYLGHLFPLHCLTFELIAKKDRDYNLVCDTVL